MYSQHNCEAPSVSDKKGVKFYKCCTRHLAIHSCVDEKIVEKFSPKLTQSCLVIEATAM